VGETVRTNICGIREGSRNISQKYTLPVKGKNQCQLYDSRCAVTPHVPNSSPTISLSLAPRVPSLSCDSILVAHRQCSQTLAMVKHGSCLGI